MKTKNKIPMRQCTGCREMKNKKEMIRVLKTAEDELTFKQSIAKSKECYVLLRVVRKIAKKKDKCEKQAIDNEFAIELDKDELKLFKGLFAEMFK